MSTQSLPDSDVSAIAQLYRRILAHGPIDTVRVSSAQARGRAKGYSYWGVAHYQLCISAKGWPCNRVVRGARSDRRSLRLAKQDAANTGLPVVGYLGTLTEAQAADVLARL